MSARVLLVGPSDPQFEELKVALEQAGFLTKTASNGIEGLVVGCEFRPHLVITEVLLSGINGFELSSRINKAEGFSTQVIFYTQSYRDEESRRVAINENGAIGYFVKPFQKGALLKSVTGLLSNIELQREKEEANGNEVGSPLLKPKSKKAPRELLQSSSTPDLSAPEIHLSARSAGMTGQGPSPLRKRRSRKTPQELLESPSRPELSAQELHLTERSPATTDQGPSPALRPGSKKVLRQLLENSLSPKLSALEAHLTETSALVGDKLPSHVRHPGKKEGRWELLESLSDGETSDPELNLAETPAITEEVSSTITPENEMKSDSELKETLLQPEIIPDPKIQPESPSSGEPSEVSAIQIPGEPELAPLRKLPFSRRTRVLIGGMVVIVALGLSLVPQFWTSRLDRPAVSIQNLDFPQSSENQTSSLNDDNSETSIESAALKEPTQIGSEASTAMVRWLKGPKSKQSTVDPDASFSHADQQQPGIQESLVHKSPSSSSSVQLMISDISPTERQPFLETMNRPSLSNAELRAMGERPYLVSLEIDEQGNVTSARLLTPNAEDSFPASILDTVRKWRFVPRDKPQQGIWMKYFSFRTQMLSK